MTYFLTKETAEVREYSDATPFVIAAFVLMLIQWFVSALTRFACCRVIPCAHVIRIAEESTNPLCKAVPKLIAAISTVMRMLITLCLTFAFLKISVIEAEPPTSVYSAFKGILIYRAFNRLYHYPLQSSLEALALLVNPHPLSRFEALTIAAFLINRLHILWNKLIYVTVSVVTAMKNKKQRFKSQTICFFLQFTILLPIPLCVILITTLLDTATIPYLGFAFFVIGYPKPLRGWSAISPVSANPNDSRSDGHLYQAMMPQLSAQIQNIISTDPFNFGRGSFYFMKNEKMIVLLQVLERGHNYVMFTAKGTELQETTVCHAEENENINEIGEELTKGKRRPHFAFSLAALK